MPTIVKENDPNIKHYRCLKCNSVRRVKGAESFRIETKCEITSCKASLFEFWKGETIKVKNAVSGDKFLLALRGVVNV